jgi:phasin family protein
VQCNILRRTLAETVKEVRRRGNEHQAAAAAEKGTTVVKNFEDMQKLGKDNMDATMSSIGALSKGFQSIAVELADYSKKVFEEGTAATEKLLGAKSLDKAIEVQSEYVKSAYEGFVSQSTKLGELYAGLAQEAYKPFESYIAKASAK